MARAVALTFHEYGYDALRSFAPPRRRGPVLEEHFSPASDVIEPQEAARSAGLRYTSDTEPGLRRRKSGAKFAYFEDGGGRIKDAVVLERIRHIVIPPAWTDVWICRFEDGHIQAIGRDARGRKQYRYHPAFREVRESTKYEHMMSFAQALPSIRAKVHRHMGLHGLPRNKVLATIVHLLETTLIRIGNDDYAKTNGSFGLTTLKNRHVAIKGAELRFRFVGKSGKQWSIAVTDRRVAKVIKACQDLPGQELLQYLDDNGVPQKVGSADVNAYLREITGRNITAKDFRTFGGTVLAALALSEMESLDTAAGAKKNVREAIKRVAARLGNTPTICRKCYVHPELLNAYLDGALLLSVKRAAERELREQLHGLSAEEAAVIAMLRARLQRKLPRHAIRGRGLRSTKGTETPATA
jgi:DNA topoisomerase I